MRQGSIPMKDDPEWKRFEQHARKTVQKISESTVTLVIGPDISTPLDIEFALQIGASVLLEKPLLVVLPEGRTLPPSSHASRIASSRRTTAMPGARGWMTRSSAS